MLLFRFALSFFFQTYTRATRTAMVSTGMAIHEVTSTVGVALELGLIVAVGVGVGSMAVANIK